MIVGGGGPAGAALAIRLCHHGIPVTVLEWRDEDADTRVGERLPDACSHRLRTLGVLSAFLADDHFVSPGLVSVWGSAVPSVADAMNPLTASRHVDRTRFDAMLRRTAVKAGATVISGRRIEGVRHIGDNRWSVTSTDGRNAECHEADVIVDATGRAGRDLLGRSRLRAAHHRLVGQAFVFPTPLGPPYSDWTLIEACTTGWWYSAPLPRAQSTAILFTDADLIGDRDGEPRALAATSGAVLTAERVPPEAPSRILRTVAWCRLREPADTITWVPVGDAAVSCDPLSGNGLSVALETAFSAADAIAAFFEGDATPLGRYAARLEASFGQHLAAQRRMYGAEQRWPAAPFWQRRHARAESLHPSTL